MLKKHIIGTGFILCVLAGTGAQTVTLDSLRGVYLASKSDSAFWYNSCLLGAVFFRSDLDSALLYSEISLDYARKAGKPNMIASSQLTIGAVYQYKDEREKAIEWYLKAYETSKAGKQQRTEAVALGNIGLLYAELENTDKAVYYLKQSLAVMLQIKDTVGIARSYANIGFNYFQQKSLDSAMVYFKKEVEWATLTDDWNMQGAGLNNIGSVLLERNQLAQARQYFLQSLEIREKNNDQQGLVNVLDNLGETLVKEGKVSAAIPYLERSMAIARQLGGWANRINPAGHLANAYALTGEHRRAYEIQKELITAKDSVFQEEKQDRTDELEARFRNQLQAAELAQKQLDLERQTGQKRLILFGALAVVLGLVALFQFFRSRLRLRRKEAELAAQLEHAEAENLRELNSVKSAFFANISHEFRTPLTLILGPLEQMMAGAFKGDFQKYYRIMHRNGKRLLDLVNQLLDLSKLESGKMRLSAARGDLAQVVSAVAQSFESLADKKLIQLQITLPESPVSGFFDRDKVEKIVANLVSNAFKFTPDNGRIHISVAPDASIAVQDTGIGIPAEQIPHLFERFYHSSSSDIQSGSGLGLALTKELAELHGGGIEVESKEEQGTTFVVKIRTDEAFFQPGEIVETPQQSGIETQMPLPAAAKPAPSSTRLALQANQPVLLIVEDNADVRAYIKDQFEGSYQIWEAENGRIGLEMAQKKTPDLIISDVMMPEMSGMELCSRLKTDEKTSHIPVIMLTARAEQTDKVEGLQTGADDYLPKPFDALELTVRVANLIEQRRRLQAHYRQALSPFAPAAVEVPGMDAVFLSRVREVVEANLEDENFSVVELGAQIGMSRSQLHRKLSALTGFSPNEVIRNMRLERAKQLLEKKAATVSEAAYGCGFSSPGYFSKCFKDYFGVLPGEV
ncbi:MAG: tetratricopeptide repeat protein [Saprospiraceae bacterium]|nr:tetratricopeptide repeat protein [Saprospiraceae bacterium]